MRTEEENPDCSDGIGCLRITSLDETDESVLKSLHANEGEDDDEFNGEDFNEDGNNPLGENEIDLYEDDSRDSDESIRKSSPHKKYSITINPG
jgi:hypothetical protein